MTAATTPATDHKFELHMESDESVLGVELNKLRLKAFKSNSATDRQAYYDALSVAFQNGMLVSSDAAVDRMHQERGAWLPIETAPRDGTRFLAAEPEDGWIIGLCRWCKTPHVPIYGFHFTDGDPENWEIANPTHWQPLPTPPALSQEERT